jgi:hypothetical protein
LREFAFAFRCFVVRVADLRSAVSLAARFHHGVSGQVLERDSNPLHADVFSTALPIELSKKRNSRESNPTALPLSPRELRIKQSTRGGIRDTQLEPFEASRTGGE